MYLTKDDIQKMLDCPSIKMYFSLNTWPKGGPLANIHNLKLAIWTKYSCGVADETASRILADFTV